MYRRRVQDKANTVILYGEYDASIGFYEEKFSIGLYESESSKPVTKELVDFLKTHAFVPHDWAPSFLAGPIIQVDLELLPNVLSGVDFYCHVQSRVIDFKAIQELKRPALYHPTSQVDDPQGA